MEQITIPVKGMHCASCALTIEKTLKKINGVEVCEVNYGTEKVKVKFDPTKTNQEEMSKKIEPLGYSLFKQEAQNRNSEVQIGTHDTHNASPSNPIKDMAHNGISSQQNDHNHTGHIMPDGTLMSGIDHSEHLGLNQSKAEKLKELQIQKNKIIFVMPITIIIFVLMMWEIGSMNFSWIPEFFLPKNLFSAISFILATVVLFWIGRPFIEGVVRFIKYRIANMDTLVGIGTLTAYVYSTLILFVPSFKELINASDFTYFDVAIVVIGFIQDVTGTGKK